ncbi:hypothetical protein COLO4_19591 [Corchorus olitorius]|uniref:Isopenicillin N synthase-like Fe(2+) 2OG dioxygenase domain-containing protein n=1 Tax=Corchorus olitorius TaxID=93759 RepID=A0A1R3J4N9_9ROSI|nr:hypothetical protein COLO4_19591 [Corchorus olitorius]
MELIGISLGLEQDYLRDFFQENDSILRLTYYPPCKTPDLTLGVGAHSDAPLLDNPPSGHGRWPSGAY